MFTQDEATVTDVRSSVWDGGRNFGATPAGQVIIKNTGTDTVYVGGSTVTSADGFPIAADQFFIIGGVGPRDELHAICGTGDSSTLRLLWTTANS